MGGSLQGWGLEMELKHDFLTWQVYYTIYWTPHVALCGACVSTL